VTSGASAGFGRRFAALIYDGLLLLALLMVFTAVSIAFTAGHVAVSRASAGGWFYAYRAGELGVIGAYYVLNWTRSGQTLGMRAWHLMAVGESGQRMSGPRALLRLLCGVLAWPPAGLGVLWLYLDADRLAVHDRLSGTRVVRLARA
jgi:uncharacterized RDD family membrane protein YckC